MVRTVKTVTTRRYTNKKHLRRALRSRVLRSVLNKKCGPHYFSRFTGSGSMTYSASAAEGGASINVNNYGMFTLGSFASPTLQYMSWTPVFSLSDLPNASEFTTLFDRYKLLSVVIKFIPINNVSATVPSGGGANCSLGGYIHSVTDYDDGNALAPSATGLNDARQYETYKTRSLLKQSTYRVRPKLAVSVFQGAFTGYGQSRSMWVDSNTNAQYFGKKFIFELFNPDGNTHYLNFKVEVEYKLVFKDVR